MSRITENNQQLKNMHVVRVTCKNKKFQFINEDKSNVVVPDFDTVEQDLIDGKHRFIVDMDAHLDTIELDFRNTFVK